MTRKSLPLEEEGASDYNFDNICMKTLYRNGGRGWSGGGDNENGRGGSNGSSGTLNQASMNNGNGIPLPDMPELAAGVGGIPDSSDGGGGGGVIIQGQKPPHDNTINGEGFGAGGGEKDQDGMPGAVFLKFY